MTITTDNKKYENALKSLEAKRKLSEARGYAAGASILANNNPKFLSDPLLYLCLDVIILI